MNKAKKVIYTIGVGVAVGAALGILFAPDKGAETRYKIRKLKRKIGLGDVDEDKHRETLEELNNALEKELAIVNKKIDKKP